MKPQQKPKREPEPEPEPLDVIRRLRKRPRIEGVSNKELTILARVALNREPKDFDEAYDVCMELAFWRPQTEIRRAWGKLLESGGSWAAGAAALLSEEGAAR
jgi:hypothetical protein